MNENCNNNLVCDNSMINGNSVDVILDGCDSEIKADIVVAEYDSVRIWGQVKNCQGDPIVYALLKLVRVVKTCNGCEYQGIAHTVSDCQGFYQFDICSDDQCSSYKILVGKSAVGGERIIMTADGNCDACTTPNYNPCGDYQYRVTPADKIDCSGKYSCGCQKPQSGCKNYCEDECKKEKRSSNHMNGCVYAPSKVRC